jgi:GNAT superfamily N-acetyltransferase
MTGKVRIRAGEPEDAGAIHAMLAALADGLGFGARFASTEATIRSHGFGPQARFSTLIAEAETPVGLALYFPHFSTTRGQPGVFIQDLWCAPACRGQGIGATLVAAVAEAAARDWGAGYVALSVHDHNRAAGRFYESLGFETVTGDRSLLLTGPAFTTLAGSRKAIA